MSVPASSVATRIGRFGSALIVAVFLIQAPARVEGAPLAALTAEQKHDAQQHLDAASKAERKRNFVAAVAEYRAAYDAAPSVAAAQGIASAEGSVPRILEAITAYELLLSQFGTLLTENARAAAAARLATLVTKTGTIAIRATPDGARIAVDGAGVGVTPPAKPIRVLPGAHRIAATMPSFLPVERAVDVTEGAEVPAELAMLPEPTGTPVSVTEAKGESLSLSVDGKVVGPLPWAGELEPGAHELVAASDKLTSPKQIVMVDRGKKLDVAFVAVPRVGKVDLHTADGRGFIVIDGKPVAEGNYVEALPIGVHAVAFVREGFNRMELTHAVLEGETWREVVTLGPTKVEAAVVPRTDERGVVGSLLFASSMQINSAGSESETNCVTLGSQCSASTPLGGGLLFSVGYMWRELGFDVLVGGILDNGSRLYADPSGNAKSYSVARVGGMQAIRVRGSIQSENFRGVVAVGPGLSERIIGIGQGFPSLPKDTSSYVSLAFTIDVSGQWRMGSSTALAAGVMLWVDDSGDGVTTLAAPTAGTFHLVSGTQTFFLPYIGLQFGP